MDSFFVPIDGAAASFVRAFYRADRPPAESLLVWRRRANWHIVFRPVTSTAEALVATGDLTLIRDDSLRSEITAYLRWMQGDVQGQEEWGASARQAIRALDQRLPFAEALRAAEGEARIDSLARAEPLYMLPEGPRRRPFPIDPEALYQDRVLLEAAEELLGAKLNLARGRRAMLEDTRDLLRRVEAEIEE